MAKFKVGDKVRHVDDGQDGPVGVVKGVYGDGKIKVKFPGLMKDGFDGFEEEELVMANGCARNAKFSKGDKVESVKTGAKGVVDEVYGDEKYAVLFDGAGSPDRVEGFQIKAANAKACNGKFKVGDSVRLVKGPAPSVGDTGKVVNVYTLTEDMAKSMGFGDYVGQDIVTFFGKGGKHIVPEAWVVAANSAPLASNRASVFEYGVGDTVKLQSGRKGEVIAKYADKNGDIKVDVSIRGTRFTVLPNEIESVIKNSAPVRSTNAVVQNAINARRARNAEEFDKGFVESKARSIYNDLDDLLDYIKRFSKSGIPTYMLASVQDAMKAIDRI